MRNPTKRRNREAALRKAEELVAEVYQVDWRPDAGVALIFLGRWAAVHTLDKHNTRPYNWYWLDRNKHQTMLFKREWNKGETNEQENTTTLVPRRRPANWTAR